jgi:hypothetical protein
MAKGTLDARGIALLAAKRFRDKNEDHTVLVLEGIHADFPDAFKVFFDCVRETYAKLGIPISKIGHDRARRYLAYPKCRNKLNDVFLGAKSLEIPSLPDGIDDPFPYCWGNAGIIRGGVSNLLHLGCESKRLPLRADLWLHLARFLITKFRPAYGYCYQRPFDHGPHLYPLCLGTDKKYPHERQGRISQWTEALRDEANLKNGWLREVFPWNFLGPDHLKAPVGDMTLREWIVQNKDCGTLAPVTGDITLWDVRDERLAETGKKLMEAGRVFDYMRDIVDKMPPGIPMSMEEAVGTVAKAFGFESPDDVEIRKGDNKPISEEEKKAFC